MESWIVKTKNLKKYYRLGTHTVKALDDVNFAVREQEFVAIIGKSGSGKSTLLHMIGGLDTPTSGEVYVGDKALGKLSKEQLAIFRRRKVGFVFQSYNLVPDLNVYGDGKMELSSKDTYKAESWEYTEDGYLMFSGWLTLKDSYEITRDKMMEYTAYRVLPLDETCRELNRKYLLPVGYACNNMFLENWSEEDLGELDFYDLFDVFHPQPVNESAYYTSDNGMKTCAVYMIPKEEFEQTIMSKFQISSEILQSKTVYHPEEKRYEYKPRGLEEVEYPEYPYPEVTEYKKNADGTLTLKVNAVFPYRGISKVYTHEVTVRDTSGGEIQYVANRIVEPMKDQDIAWHKPRLTRAEWEAQYGGK